MGCKGWCPAYQLSMTGLEIIALIKGFFQFFPEVRKLINILQQSSATRKALIVEELDQEDRKLRETGRPTW